jgi:hypothetical protein
MTADHEQLFAYIPPTTPLPRPGNPEHVPEPSPTPAVPVVPEPQPGTTPEPVMPPSPNPGPQPEPATQPSPEPNPGPHIEQSPVA